MAGQIPKGVEVLVKKAAVDPEFKAVLLDRRAEAAGRIGLELDAAEAMMLAAVPREQLEAIVARTTVPAEHRRAFLGQAAAAMLAAVGVMAAGEAVAGGFGSGGIRPDAKPDRILPTRGIQPDRPALAEQIERRVIEMVARRAKVDKKEITAGTSFVTDLKADPKWLLGIKKDLEQGFKIKIPGAEFKKIRSVGQAAEYVYSAIEGREEEIQRRRETTKPKADPLSLTFGIRPDRPLGPLGGSRPDRP